MMYFCCCSLPGDACVVRVSLNHNAGFEVTDQSTRETVHDKLDSLPLRKQQAGQGESGHGYICHSFECCLCSEGNFWFIYQMSSHAKEQLEGTITGCTMYVSAALHHLASPCLHQDIVTERPSVHLSNS